MNQTAAEHKSRYLLVKHSRGWNVDRCCVWMQNNAQPFDWFYPLEGEPFPSLEPYAGVIIFGGASSANDDSCCDWVRQELVFVEQVLKQQKSFLGLCLGAQMLARVLGSPVFRLPGEIKEVGFHPVFPTADSGDFLPAPQHFMQWHSEGFNLPAGCDSVAHGDVFPNQAFKYQHDVYGLQFHPEVNAAALAIWHERNRLKNPQPLTEPQRQQQMQDAHKYDHSISAWLDAFLTRWTQAAEASSQL